MLAEHRVPEVLSGEVRGKHPTWLGLREGLTVWLPLQETGSQPTAAHSLRAPGLPGPRPSPKIVLGDVVRHPQ